MKPHDSNLTASCWRGWRGVMAIVLATFVVVGVLAIGTTPWGTAEAQADNQCVACHTNSAKLQALTPPDPPSTEEGEG